MADITMCQGAGCPKRATCYRAMAKVDALAQSWFLDNPRYPDGSCEHYWPISAAAATADADKAQQRTEEGMEILHDYERSQGRRD